MRLLILLTTLLLGTSLLQAQEHAATAPPATGTEAAAHAPVADLQPHPTLSQDSSWAGGMIIIVLGMFLAAAVIGPIVRANTPEELPPAHSHDEPPGTSGHHSASGTIDTHEPEHDSGHGH